MAANAFWPGAYGNVALLVSSIETERGRDIAVQSPSQGDDHVLFDRGRRLRRTTCEILFCNQAGLKPFKERYDEFIELAELGEPQVFMHAIDGSYVARAEALQTSSAADSKSIRVSCTFLRDTTTPFVFPIAAGGSVTAGVEGVSVSAAAAAAAFAELELEDSVMKDATAMVTAWSEADELDTNQVFLGVAAMAQAIDDAIDRYELAKDLARWPAYEQLVVLRYQVVLAAELFTSDAETVVDLYVDVPRPLLSICAEIYGAAEAQERAEQATRRNRIRTPARVPAGTTLKMAVPRRAA